MFIQAGRHRTRALALVTITALGAALWGIASGDGAGAVGINPATVTVTSNANPSVNGQTVTFTATVTGSSGVPTGKVTPYKNGSSQSSVTLDAQGRASWSTIFSPGTATISATYKGSSVYAVATSPTLTQTTTPAPTTTVVTSSANPSVVGASVTLTATNTAVAPGTCTINSGTVNFYDGTTKIGSKSASSGKAAISITTLARGPHAITATFPGTSKCLGSTSAVVTQTVAPRPTTTTLTSTPNPSALGQSVTFTATVASSSGTPTGTVTFTDASTVLGSASLSSGHAAITVASLSAGSHSVVASYAGANDDAASTSAPRVQTVTGAGTTTALASDVNPSTAGQSVTFTATVTGGSGTPGGTVTFTDGTSTLGTGALAAGQATLTTSALAPGTHAITATYGGDTTSTGSTSTPLTQTVSGATSSTVVGSSVNPSTAGQSVTFTATVTGGSGTPGGTVTFTDGTSTLGTGALAAGQATLTTSALAPGTHAITATYGGDTTYTGSASSPLTQTVNASAANVLFVDKANPSCTNSGTGAGTSATPFCAINSAAAKATAGVSVVVATGTYNEKVTVTSSGTASAPITFTTAPGATVTVSGGSNGFSISTKSWVIIHGFTVTTTTGVGITVSSSTNITIDGNRVTNAGLPVSGSTATGIKLNATSASTVSNNTTDHNSDAGVYVTTDSNGNTIRNNVSFANARGYVRAAAGFDLRNSTGNVVYGNISHDNEDSGFNVWTGTTWGSNLVDDNVAYANGDHGIDVHNAVDARIISNTVSGNYDSGIEMTTSIGSLLANNISVDNGMNSVRTSGNIRADSASVSGGSTVNDDLVSLSTPGVMVDWGGVKYASLAAFQAATGQESRGIEAIPRFVNGPGADFHLLAGSPAIDAANTAIATEPAVDFDGTARVDDPATVDTGIGPVTFADRERSNTVRDVDTVTVDLAPERATATITLDRPEKKNALSAHLRDEVADRLATLAGDERVNSVVITGAGDVFSAGFDLGEFGRAAEDPDFGRELWASSDRFHHRLLTFPLPLIAAVNGPALAGGFDLAVCCDVRIAADTARFAHPEFTFGDVVYSPLHELVGGAVARDLCLTGRSIDAAEAHRLHLVSDVVPRPQLTAKVAEVTDRIATAPRAMILRTKAKAIARAGIALGPTLDL